MKGKYYLRGIGVGIVFTSIMFLFIQPGTKDMSDEEILRRAAQLGMVESKETVLPEKPSNSTEGEEGQNTTEQITQEETTDTSTTTEATTEVTTEATTQATTEATTEAKLVTFTVVSGMHSLSVARLLQDLGVIEHADDFDAFLEREGYSSRIATGTYTVAVGESYENIAKMLISGN